MAKSSFFKDGGAGTNTAASIQNQVDAAAASATSAATSLAAIGTELTDATAAKVAAEAAQAAAEAAQTSSEGARDTAITNRNAADTSAASASTSATNSASSETNAAASQSAAAISASNAATSETNSAASQAAAATSAGNASTSETNAATSATSSAAAQAASETARDASVVAKNSSETAKTASEAARDLSLSYRNTAETHKNSAAASATAAASSQSAAATSATGASSSASSAASAQTAAEAARDSALAAFDSFDDRYLGAKATGGGVGDPTVDNDGNSLVSGTLFYDTTNNVIKVYTGSAWVAAYVSGGSFAALSGATFTGDVTVPNLITAGNVDGRDVSVDGTKLDGIASGATAVSSLTDLSISDGTNGQALKTDGAGNFSFGDVSSSTAFADITGKPTTISGYGITDAFDGAYGSLTGAPTIPTAVSQLTNDSGFITSANGGNAATLDSLDSTQFLRSDTADTASGKITMATGIARNAHQVGHLEGGYNNVGANSTNSNPIFTIGSAYNPASTTLSNMYGVGYSHHNATFISQTMGWGMYVAADGDARVMLSGSYGHGFFTGNVTAYASDERLKTNVKPVENALDKVCKLRGVEFDWVDNITSEYDFHPMSMHETGVIAQNVAEVIPDAVREAPFNGNYTQKCGTDHEFLTVDKEKIIPVLIEAIKELKAEVDELKAGCCHGSTE